MADIILPLVIRVTLKWIYQTVRSSMEILLTCWMQPLLRARAPRLQNSGDLPEEPSCVATRVQQCNVNIPDRVLLGMPSGSVKPTLASSTAYSLD